MVIQLQYEVFFDYIFQIILYYLNNIINNSETNIFLLNITSCYNGAGNFEIKIKDSKNNYYNFNNYSVNIFGNCSFYNPTIDNKNNT